MKLTDAKRRAKVFVADLAIGVTCKELAPEYFLPMSKASVVLGELMDLDNEFGKALIADVLFETRANLLLSRHLELVV